ncbi:MAG: 4tm region of dna translocase ftsk/spoiiie [Verrucomicrobiaceae bacterium]|nr:4tm region of dna translocase ftsk/spoiiie [Verrucomicrobiaceae bacterium]
MPVPPPRTAPVRNSARAVAAARPQINDHSWHDFSGLFMLGLAVFLLLALFSYDAHDLPSWAMGNPTDTQNDPPVNFIGRAGAFGAFVSLMAVGVASYLIPFSLTWFGVCRVASSQATTFRHWLGMMLIVLTGAAMVDVWTGDLSHQEVSPFGSGGAIGRLIGGRVFSNLFGHAGSLMVLGTIYAVGLIFVTGLHPIAVLRTARREVPLMIGRMIQNWRERSAQAAEEFTPALEDPVETRRKVRAKVPTPSAVGSSTATEPPAPETFTAQDLPLTFEPKIIDSSSPKPLLKDDNRPSLSDVWTKKRAQKIEQSGPAPMGSLTDRYRNYTLPTLDLLQWPDPSLVAPADPLELKEMQETIVRTLDSFGIKVTKGDITRGPAITRYEVRPVDGLRVSRIATLDADLARATKAERINILAPIPGKDTVGIEIANRNKVVVPVRELLEDDAFQNPKAKLPLALGKDVYGKTIIADLAAMPHLLVAGATGSGKSVCINTIITSLICRFAPDELRFIMIDPKVVEMQTYAELPHLALPVVTDPKKALLALRWVVREMETRYQVFAAEGCRNFETFNSRNRKKTSDTRPAKNAAATVSTGGATTMGPEEMAVLAGIGEVQQTVTASLEKAEDTETMLVNANGDWSGDSQPPTRAAARGQELIIPDTMPYIVVIIDELADLMQTAPADIEVAIARITQMARAAGIHLIVATQTPRADVITGVIKANVPSRIAFQVASALDSRVILDRKGAEKLVGKGDMLYLPPGTANLVRSQGALVTDEEIHALVGHCVSQGRPVFDTGEKNIGSMSGGFGDEDEEDEVNAEDEKILEKCLEVIRQEKKASTSLLQRRLGLGYTRAARMMDILEDRGIIGPGEGAKPREILVQLD